MPVFLRAPVSANAARRAGQSYRGVSITCTKIENQGNKASKPSRQEGRELSGKEKYLSKNDFRLLGFISGGGGRKREKLLY